ncbi:MAG: nitroreductase [Rhodospirillaceae bacterium]
MSPTTKPVPTRAATDIDEAILTRHSIRAFLPTPVAKETVAEILEVSARAPSGTNMQPWQVYVLTGEVKQALSRDILAAHDALGAGHAPEVLYYPREFFEPFRARRRKVGWDLYGLLGIGKGDKDKMHAQHGRNYTFFDAPVGLMFTIHRDLETGSWLDYGMFLQNVMLAARGRGLHTCPQAAFTQYHQVIRKHLPLTDDEVVVCGMSMGYADPDAIENTLVTEREPVETYTKFIGF